MCKFILVLACLACAGHGRRMQSSNDRLQRSRYAENEQPVKMVDFESVTQPNIPFSTHSSLSALKPFVAPLQTQPPIAAIHPSSPKVSWDDLRRRGDGAGGGAGGDGGEGDENEGDSLVSLGVEAARANEGAGIHYVRHSANADDDGEATDVESVEDGEDSEDDEDDEDGEEGTQQPGMVRITITEFIQGGDQQQPSFGGPGRGGSAAPGSFDEEENNELQDLERRLHAAKLPKEVHEVAFKELSRMANMMPMHAEYTSLVEYLELIASLPWANATADHVSISAAREQLESDHFGMERVKARILEYLSVCKLKGDLRSPIICLHGPPGIGKTSLGKSIAEALNRDFYRVSLGGVHSEAEVRGHRRTYVGAQPGLIIQALKKCGTNNCVIMLDEVDKLGQNSINGDPSSALLEVLDPEQNSNFRDHFLNLPFNLSTVLFIATANDLGPIPRPLLDRMEIIDMSGYTVEEKIQIANRHLLPKQLQRHGLDKSAIAMEEPVIDALISGYTREAGVRELDRQIAALCRSVAVHSAEAAEAAEADTQAGATSSVTSANVGSAGGKVTGGTIHAENLTDILGPPKYDGPRDNLHRLSKPGIAAGLAWTPVGGDVLFVEADRMSGRGELTITGQLGDVMVESVKIATGWVRAHAEELGISEAGAMLLNGTDLHIHFPAGAVPKDGPSAGVTITTAIVSLLTGRLVRPDLAMTGEISLRGLVLPVGGIKEKLIAAHRAGMKHILIPAKNEKDLRDLPASVLEEMDIKLMTDVHEVLIEALLPVGATTSPDGEQVVDEQSESVVVEELPQEDVLPASQLRRPRWWR